MHKRRYYLILVVAIVAASLLLVLLNEPSSPRVVRARAAYDLSPDVPSDDIRILVKGNNIFAFDLYQTLRERNGNLVFSPFSLSQAFAMAYAGARGQTEREMADTLRYQMTQDRLHPAFNAFLLDIESAEATGNKIIVANSLWGQKGFSFEREFLDTLSVNYDAGMQIVDFESAPEKAAEAANEWVSHETEGLINDLIPPDSLNDDGNPTRLLLLNAVYLKADWQYVFPKASTRKGDFHLLNGDTVQVNMMDLDQALPYQYAHFEGFEALELPYAGDRLAMLIVMPDEGAFSTIESWLDMSTFNAIRQALERAFIAIRMPKFEIHSNIDGLLEILQQMGMKRAFSPAAEFPGINRNVPLRIDDVFHQSFMRVDEEGTEAAAATSIEAVEVSLVVYTYVTIDRPFVFMLFDRQTGAVLFMGRVLNPSE